MFAEMAALSDGASAATVDKSAALKILGAGAVSLLASVAAGYYTHKAVTKGGAKNKAGGVAAGVGVAAATDVALSTAIAKTVLKDEYAKLYADPNLKEYAGYADYALPTWNKVSGMLKKSTAAAGTSSGNTTSVNTPTAAELKAKQEEIARLAEAKAAEAAAAAKALAEQALTTVPTGGSGGVELTGIHGVTVPALTEFGLSDHATGNRTSLYA